MAGALRSSRPLVNLNATCRLEPGYQARTRPSMASSLSGSQSTAGSSIRMLSASTRPFIASSLPSSQRGAYPSIRMLSASTRPCMAASLPASQSGASVLAASWMPPPATPVTARSRAATVSATALMISAAAARADTAAVQSVNPAGRAETLIVSALVPIVPSSHLATDREPEARGSGDARNPRNPYRSRRRAGTPWRWGIGLVRAVLLGLRLVAGDDALQEAMRGELKTALGAGQELRRVRTAAARLERLTERRRKLLELYYAEKLGAELFAEEEARISGQIDVLRREREQREAERTRL